ncbi:alcohol dehydrogenase [Mizugakiibacter sediminis]|uniref:Alcohol dehydrogenase n=1 Tax=Mizugakiibacter sediminis TaxID=1475481 RepID=A0A0K8QRM2_9GAMM|nr:NAD(P)-dependent alcohol dehydrogenase [Mizugakiibacter sediminis]GAP67548.1 alcohol dehydrogenase [Mizugakiibacter sediminis]
MQTYRIVRGGGIGTLARVEQASPPLAARQVRVRMRAVALNNRDLQVAEGGGRAAAGAAVVPASDGAGEVVEVGAGVTRFRVGDRVLAAYFPDWIDGLPTPETTVSGLGGAIDGVLAEEIVAAEHALVALPPGLDFVEAATVPCAGVTAWHALFVAASLPPGSDVLLLGTGGVSVWALQLAAAAGLRAIVTSSDDAKLERARALGAVETVNYRRAPEWQDEVRRLTGGRGVDLVVEVGGRDTLRRSIAATRNGGTIAMVGGVGGGFGVELGPFALIGGVHRLVGVLVGSRAMAERLLRFVAHARIRPVIDRVFAFGRAHEAYAHLASGRHFGKVVVALD